MDADAIALPEYFLNLPAMKLCVVSDIFARPTAADCISVRLPHVTEIVRFSLGDLCGYPCLIGESLHRYLFNNRGIEKAAQALKERLGTGYFGLGYSAGGTALWRAAAQGAQFEAIYCLSSTRLRDETAISTPNHVFFGALDQNIPRSDWISLVPADCTVHSDADHCFYLDANSKEANETRVKISGHMARLSGHR